MTITGFIFWGCIAVLLVYLILIYNNLVTLKHNVSKAWSNIDVLLKQRHDELPKLVETCRQYMQYEQDTLEKVMQARQSVASAQQQGDISALGAAEGSLRLGLGSLFAVAEAYPELKADESVKNIQIILITAVRTETTDRIKGLEIGADAFITKPIDEGELVAQLKVMLRIKKAEDALTPIFTGTLDSRIAP
ncbi:hypothetical protein LCGC14_1452000 [marine sediment metagenome]|uniref:Response regulatory domain-containing protein n=1 Tax=marine sediment metagenome TaxID=412755 RepID=A0A0F9JID2_9ZZZZ